MLLRCPFCNGDSQGRVHVVREAMCPNYDPPSYPAVPNGEDFSCPKCDGQGFTRATITQSLLWFPRWLRHTVFQDDIL